MFELYAILFTKIGKPAAGLNLRTERNVIVQTVISFSKPKNFLLSSRHDKSQLLLLLFVIPSFHIHSQIQFFIRGK